MAEARQDGLRVGLIGLGAIGRRVAQSLRAGEVAGARLTAVLVRDPSRAWLDGPGGGVGDGVVVTSDVADLVAACDLVVETASQQALALHAPAVLGAGVDLVAVSVGALGDPEPLAGLGPGRLIVCPGAIGGTDLLRAVARSGGFDWLRLTTEKRPTALDQPWMAQDLRARLAEMTANDEPVELYRGPVAEAARLFPSNLNLAVTAALASGTRDVEAVLVATARLPRTRHTLEGASALGRYRIELEHESLADQPRTSAVVPAAVLVTIEDHVRGGGRWWTS